MSNKAGFLDNDYINQEFDGELERAFCRNRAAIQIRLKDPEMVS